MSDPLRIAVVAEGPTDRIIECLPNPYLRLGQQKKGVRIKKRKADYERKSREIEAAWPRIATANGLVEAQRFQADVRIALGIL